MPRRKQVKIHAKDTTIYNLIVNELKQNPELASDYDMESIEITILKKKSPPRIKDIDKAIAYLKRYIAINSKHIETFQGEAIVNKKEIAGMMKVSRPTLDKWIKDGFIYPVQSKYINQLETYPPDVILEQLLKQKNEK